MTIIPQKNQKVKLPKSERQEVFAMKLYLKRGFPLPMLHGFTLQNAEIVWTDSTVIVCCDMAFTEQYYYPNQQPLLLQLIT